MKKQMDFADFSQTEEILKYLENPNNVISMMDQLYEMQMLDFNKELPKRIIVLKKTIILYEINRINNLITLCNYPICTTVNINSPFEQLAEIYKMMCLCYGGINFSLQSQDVVEKCAFSNTYLSFYVLFPFLLLEI